METRLWERQEETVSVKDLGEKNCGRNSYQKKSLQMLWIVESSSTADNGGHHCLYCRASGLFDTAGLVVVATPTFPGMKTQMLSECALVQVLSAE